MFYGARYYDSGLSRFISADTVVPQAGNPQDFNRYGYARNNPLKYTDPSGRRPCDEDESGKCVEEDPAPPTPPTIPDAPWGGDPADPWQVGTEWLTGQGPRHHEFREGDEFTELLKKHDHVEQVRKTVVRRVRSRSYSSDEIDYNLSGLEGVPKYVADYSTLATAGYTGNLAVTYLGSYELKYYVLSVDRNTGTAEILFHVENASTLGSGLRPPVVGYSEFWTQHVEPVVTGSRQSGPMSTTTQSFWWTETLHYR